MEGYRYLSYYIKWSKYKLYIKCNNKEIFIFYRMVGKLKYYIKI